MAALLDANALPGQASTFVVGDHIADAAGDAGNWIDALLVLRDAGVVDRRVVDPGEVIHW